MEELDRMEDMFVVPGGENMSSVKFSDAVTYFGASVLLWNDWLGKRP